MAATDTSCSLRSGSRREGLHKDHINSMHSLLKKGNKTRGHDAVEISDGNGCDDTCNINCRLQRMFRFTNQTSKSRAVVLSFNFVNGLAFGLLVHDHNCQIPDNVSEHRFQDARRHDPCIKVNVYGERRRKKKRKEEKKKKKREATCTSGTEQKEGKGKTGWGLVTPAAPEAEHPEARARVLGTPKKKAGTLLIG